MGPGWMDGTQWFMYMRTSDVTLGCGYTVTEHLTALPSCPLEVVVVVVVVIVVPFACLAWVPTVHTHPSIHPRQVTDWMHDRLAKTSGRVWCTMYVRTLYYGCEAACRWQSNIDGTSSTGPSVVKPGIIRLRCPVRWGKGNNM